MGAAQIFAVDRNPFRLEMAMKMGATHTLAPTPSVARDIREATGNCGVDVSIEALGMQETFENALRALRPGGTLSSIGVYSGHLRIPLEAFGAGLADVRIVTTLCPGGKARMSRLMRLVASGRIDLKPLLTHRFELAHIVDAYRLFESQADNVLKIAIHA
jgi:threonine dehydrogenase-like Zn-dependent dehydrogenase